MVKIIKQQPSNDGDVFVMDVTSDQSRWILDSGCTYHMCLRRDWFHSFKKKKINGGPVLLGDNHTCKIQGIGNIAIKMFNGIIRTVNDVRYVRNSREICSLLVNLIFLVSNTRLRMKL